MSNKINWRILKLRSRILRNMLAIIGLAGFITACSGNRKQDIQSNEDSLAAVKQKHQQDSLAKVKADSLLQVREDSIAKFREDSAKQAKAQQTIKPNIVPPIIQTTDYGVIPYEVNPPIQVRYGSPSVDKPANL